MCWEMSSKQFKSVNITSSDPKKKSHFSLKIDDAKSVQLNKIIDKTQAIQFW
jgi:hypothetical protein